MYKSLQAGRAVAAILVVLFHLGGAIAAEKYFGYKEFSVPFSFGASGVEFFFVLSGFIIFTAHQRDIFKPEKLIRYIRKRLVRIYPSYLIVFCSVLVLSIASPQLRSTVPHDALTLFKSLLLIPQDKNVVGGSGAPVIIVAWTLQYEMFFYLGFALLIASRWLSAIFLAVLIYLYARHFGGSALAFPTSFFTSSYNFLFALGMMVSVACTTKKWRVNHPNHYTTIGAAAFLLIALDTVLQINLLSEQKTILYGLACSLIVFGLAQAENNGHVVGGQRWAQLLGNSSYALYLIHYPLISILCKLALWLQLDRLGIAGAAMAYLAIFCACLASAVAFHLWIEKPVAGYFRNRSAVS